MENGKKEQNLNPDININESKLLTGNEYMLTPPAPWNKLFRREFLVKNNNFLPKFPPVSSFIISILAFANISFAIFILSSMIEA